MLLLLLIRLEIDDAAPMRCKHRTYGDHEPAAHLVRNSFSVDAVNIAHALFEFEFSRLITILMGCKLK